jgi:hypothetical protein
MSMARLIQLLVMISTAAASAASASEVPNKHGVIADWDGLLGNYHGRNAQNTQDCEVEISTSTHWLLGTQLDISITQTDGENLDFTAPLATYKKSLAKGNNSMGTAAYAEKTKGFALGRHSTTYGMLHFNEAHVANQVWPLRGVSLSWSEVDFYLVTDSLQLSCWSLQKDD